MAIILLRMFVISPVENATKLQAWHFLTLRTLSQKVDLGESMLGKHV